MIPVIPKPRFARILTPSTYCYKEEDVIEVYDELVPISGYRLLCDNTGVRLFASEKSGFFYGRQTVKQLLAAGDLPNVEIKDSPRYPYRGYMLDCSRHFFTIEEIKKQIDIIALFKLNIFHWHLADDQGWRAEIEKYSLLTEIGSRRSSTRGDGKPVKGYYTKAEMADVVAYAAERFIEVIPEIDIPGHTSAAIAAYPYLSCDGKQIAVKESFGIHPEVICAGKEAGYTFIKDVLAELFEIFPCKYIHLGGDEALRLHWLDCEDCQRTIKENGLKDEDELQAYFMGKIAEFCRVNGRTVINWNDGMVGENVAEDIIVQYWQENAVNRAAAIREINRGKKAIISPFFSYYLDYPYGMTPLKKTFRCNPEIEGVDRKDGIIGVEAPLWAEYVETLEDIERQTYPRLLAVAERGWSDWHTDYADFRARLKYAYNMFDKKGIACAKIGKVDPGIFTGKLTSLIKFFSKVLDKNSLAEHKKNVGLNKKRLAAKYKK